MYLKKLEILGFKSFANKTTINFSQGLTAIVGPNGCGKTNILDALRWVLGEQRISALRGSKMEEVIFNGTKDMKPLGMAEVTLSIVNNDGSLPTEYNEVQITRRLFRSGESEYLLNKVPCRLKDITELFYDTGLGSHSYSVIQQDMIEGIISDKAEDRRFLFEEAAGITKYKQRKKAALRKLEATENDFLRLNDIYTEVQTQVRSLKRQQKKAERYQFVTKEIKEWELYLNAHYTGIINQNKRTLQNDYNNLSDQLSQKEANLNVLSSQLEIDRKEQIDIEHKLTSVGNEIFEMSEKAHALEKEISILKEKKTNNETLKERNQNDIETSNKRSQLLNEEIKNAQTDVEKQKNELTRVENELQEAESIQAKADEQLLAARSNREQTNSQLMELESKLSSGKTQEDNLSQQRQELAHTLETISNNFQNNQREQEKLQIQQQQQKDIFAQLTTKKQDIESKTTNQTARLEQLIEKNEELTQEISNTTASLEACQARKNLLEDMILHYEGYESGVKTAMELKKQWAGIYGTVAEKFIPVEGLEVALEAALGDMSKFLICEDRPTGESIINFLKKEKKGRIGILIPDTGTINPVVKRPELELPEFIGWMDSFVSTDDKLKPLMQAVLSRIAVFKSGFNPNAILERLPFGFKAVSTEGDLYSKNVISGGSDDQFPLFRRQEKVKEQDEIARQLQQQLNNIKENKNQINAEIAEIRAELRNLAEAIENINEEYNTIQKQINETEYQLRTLEKENKRLADEKQQIKNKLEIIQNHQYSLGLDFNQLAHQKENLMGAMTESKKQLNDYEDAALKAMEKVSSLQVKLVEARSKIEQTENKLKHLQELLLEITNTITIKNEEINNAHNENINLTEKIEHLEKELKHYFHQRQEITSQQNSLHTKQNDILTRVSEKEKQLAELRTQKEEIRQKIHQLDIRLNTIEAEMKTIQEKIQENYDVDITTIEVKNPNEELTDEQAEEHLLELKEKLKKFGIVNLLALEEYRTASEREQFLKEQLNDLSTAKTDLQTTINKINHTAQQLFLETFENVKVNFQNLFVELFTGGEANIFLVDPNNPLESDIEIIARPKGKKNISITMMSAGERALTAIALLFSLYLVKPSPFCILDEVDAPLDDINCRRFLKILGKFSSTTQFIVITHNKISMEAAQNIYGVTMEQFGVSKLVAVKFTEKENEIIVDNIIDDRTQDPLSDKKTTEDFNFTASTLSPSQETPQKIIDRLDQNVINVSDNEEQK